MIKKDMKKMTHISLEASAWASQGNWIVTLNKRHDWWVVVVG